MTQISNTQHQIENTVIFEPATSEKFPSWKSSCIGLACATTVLATAYFLGKIDLFNYPQNGHPHNDLLLLQADVNRTMATDIGSINDISTLQKINGVAINIIESRARPNSWASTGFLGEHESLLDLLEKDWKTVQDLGTTHIELADHLKAIDELLTQETAESITKLYNFSKVKNNTINVDSMTRSLKLQKSCTKGFQADIFCNNPKTDQCEFAGWQCELIVLNPINGESVNVGMGVIDYIRKYGFYEGGGKNNSYRVDPIRLSAVFTSHSYCSIAKAINQTC